MFTLYITLTTSLLVGALFLHLLPRWGKIGQEWAEKLCYAPVIDLALSCFMLLPLLIGFIVQKSSGLAIALASEFSALWIWIIVHEWIHREQWQDSKIHRTNSRIFGGWRNHLAMWITALAIPIFWLVRFAEIIVYPSLTQLVKLPKYEAKDWVNVSRHKFAGLIGYDLIWCLYCDWMTGVWSLGTEMLRNVESFWCPIRFYSDKKCANCQIDFPDIEKGWVSSDSTMQDVEKLLNQKYSNTPESSWFGHPCRLENQKND